MYKCRRLPSPPCLLYKFTKQVHEAAPSASLRTSICLPTPGLDRSRDPTDPTAMGSFANPAAIPLAAKFAAESSSPPWGSSSGRDGSAGARRLPSSSLRGSLPTGGSRGKGGGHGVSVPALSPLHEAAAAGQAETLSLLIDIGVSLEARDTSGGDWTPGDTALGRAVREGQLE